MFNFEEANKLLEQDNHSDNMLVLNDNTPKVSLIGRPDFNQILSLEESLQEMDFQPLIKKAENQEVATISDAKQALSMALQARKISQSLEKSRLEAIKPQVEIQRGINKIVGDYKEKLQKMEENLKNKISHWMETGTSEAFPCGLESIQVIDGSIRSSEYWDYEVLQKELVPLKYLKIDEKEIKKDIDAGVRDIEGVYISLKKETKLRLKN